ncbi:MAG: thioredoxin family protein [bacterium]|nr:thioredoxin family protein [bacterium]
MIIKVLGTGCANCKRLEENTKKAVQEMGIDALIVKVEDIAEIVSFGVMKTPALVVNEKVKVLGRVPSVEDIKQYLR